MGTAFGGWGGGVPGVVPTSEDLLSAGENLSACPGPPVLATEPPTLPGRLGSQYPLWVSGPHSCYITEKCLDTPKQESRAGLG